MSNPVAKVGDYIHWGGDFITITKVFRKDGIWTYVGNHQYNQSESQELYFYQKHVWKDMVFTPEQFFQRTLEQ